MAIELPGNISACESRWFTERPVPRKEKEKNHMADVMHISRPVCDIVYLKGSYGSFFAGPVISPFWSFPRS